MLALDAGKENQQVKLCETGLLISVSNMDQYNEVEAADEL